MGKARALHKLAVRIGVHLHSRYVGLIADSWLEELSKGDAVGKEDRGFASMDREKQREIASKGGKVAHEKGRAHQWSREEARAAGRKGGLAAHQRRQATSLTE